MRTLALLLVSILPCAVAVAETSNIPSNVSTMGRPVRVTLVNFSPQQRQVRLKSGDLELPFGVRVDIDTHVGATIYIVSNTHQSVDERLVIKSGDDARYFDIR